MKRTICMLFSFMLLFLTSCKSLSPLTVTKENEKVLRAESKGVLMVNGVNVTANDVTVNHEQQYVKLPFITILKALGAEVHWDSNEKVEIILDGKEYVLNPSKNSMHQEGDSFNLIALPPGTQHGAYYQMDNCEFFVDNHSLDHFMNLHGIKIVIDYESAVVSVSKK